MTPHRNHAVGVFVLVTSLLLVFVLFETVATAAAPTLRVMTLNTWHGGKSGGQPLEQTAAVIKAGKADLVGLQEANAGATKLAALLGWQHVDQGGGTSILTRHPIVGMTPKKWGAKIELPNGMHAYLFNVHFAHIPYQPYQLLNIRYGKYPFLETEAEAVEAAQKARGGQVGRMLAEVEEVRGENVPMFVTGDFNEPSHLDWTAAGCKAKFCPIAVQWPTTKAVADAGFIDGFRDVYPDPLQRRGLTWTPITKYTDPMDRHDRIDFVFAAGAKAVAAEVIGEHVDHADVVVAPYPSDHRAVVVAFEIER